MVVLRSVSCVVFANLMSVIDSLERKNAEFVLCVAFRFRNSFCGSEIKIVQTLAYNVLFAT